MPSIFFLSLLSLLASDIPVSLQPGFKLTLHAGPQLADNIYSITVNPQGHLVAASRNYIHVLIDDNNDGAADRSIPFSATPADGAMSLLWEGDHLYCPGDGHLLRFTDANHDNQADGPPEKLIPLKTGGEHTAHAVKRGPDGWLYILCGDDTAPNKSFVTGSDSPITDPIAGCVVRISPDWKTRHIVVDGLRNAYGMDWNSAGELFTYDSDNERCVSLPWYEGTRFYHLWEGGHCGWRSSTEGRTMFRYPPYFLDVIPPLADLGRGSPTGVVCYRHLQFPEDYRDGLFLLDWTFGKIYFARLKPHGSTYIASIETFLEATGDNGMAPTDAVVHPQTGDLYFSIGGRGTRGSIYRVRYVPGKRTFSKEELEGIADDAPVSTQLAKKGPEEIVAITADSNPFSRRHALDAMNRRQGEFTDEQRATAIQSNWGDSDRSLRQASARLIGACTPETRKLLEAKVHFGREASTLGLVSPFNEEWAIRAFALLQHGTPQERLEGVRLIQRGIGEMPAASVIGTIWEGYSQPAHSGGRPTGSNSLIRPLTPHFPSNDALLNFELARTLAIVADNQVHNIKKMLDQTTLRSDPVADIHYLACAARLVGERSEENTSKTAAALLELPRKIEKQSLARDRNWSLRVNEVVQKLAEQDANLLPELLKQKDFGRPDHLVFIPDETKTNIAKFAKEIQSFREAAAAIFLQRAVSEPEYTWSTTLVQLFKILPAEKTFPPLRQRSDDLGLRDAILDALAQAPEEADRDRFLSGLSSPQLKTVASCLSAIEKLPPRLSGEDVAALVDGLRRLPDGKETTKLRDRYVTLLRRLTGQENLGDNKNGWLAWAIQKYPEFAAKLENAGSVDLPKWRSRWSGIDWSKGNVDHGREAFRKLACVQCHSGAKALGPDLAGSSGRYSRDDLMTAIVAPSRDVPERYRTLLVAADDGNVYQGLVIYESSEALLLQTSPDQTVRLNGSQISSRQQSDKSLMPDGLLDKASDAEINDLIAYIRSLGAPLK